MVAEKIIPSMAERVIAIHVTEDEYMRDYAEHFYEWVDGVVIKMSPVTAKHDGLSVYLRQLLDTYFALRPIGKVRSEPFVMKADNSPRRREPDLQVILNTNPGKLTETAMLGAADICIEIVSEGSQETDYVTKFVEYQQAGVREYWLIDPLTEQPRFFRLNADGRYEPQSPDADGYYETPLLPGLKLHVPTLWSDPLPNTIAVVQAVQMMLNISK